MDSVNSRGFWFKGYVGVSPPLTDLHDPDLSCTPKLTRHVSEHQSYYGR